MQSKLSRARTVESELGTVRKEGLSMTKGKVESELGIARKAESHLGTTTKVESKLVTTTKLELELSTTKK